MRSQRSSNSELARHPGYVTKAYTGSGWMTTFRDFKWRGESLEFGRVSENPKLYRAQGPTCCQLIVIVVVAGDMQIRGTTLHGRLSFAAVCLPMPALRLVAVISALVQETMRDKYFVFSWAVPDLSARLACNFKTAGSTGMTQFSLTKRLTVQPV